MVEIKQDSMTRRIIICPECHGVIPPVVGTYYIYTSVNDEDVLLQDTLKGAEYAGVIFVEQPFLAYSYHPHNDQSLSPNELDKAVNEIMVMLEN